MNFGSLTSNTMFSVINFLRETVTMVPVPEPVPEANDPLYAHLVCHETLTPSPRSPAEPEHIPMAPQPNYLYETVTMTSEPKKRWERKDKRLSSIN